MSKKKKDDLHQNSMLVSSEDALDYMGFKEEHDPKKDNIVDKDDAWYYNDKTHVTNTHLGKLLNGGPQHLKMYYEHGQMESEAMIFGRAAHCLLLEPELFSQRYYAIDDTEKCIEISGKDWKDKNKKPRSTTKYKEWINELMAKNRHRDLLSLDNLNTIEEMIDRAMSYPQVREMIEAATKKEVIYAKEIYGVKCKCKTDGINPTNFVLDYKTMKDPATIYNLTRVMQQRGYDRQGSFYKDITGVDSVWILAQEKTYPYTVCLAEMSPSMLEAGKSKYMTGLEMYKRHFIDNPKGIDTYFETGMV